jgi:hypothetical protein
MKCEHKEQEGSLYVFCEESKIWNWIVSNVFLVVGGIWLSLAILNLLTEGVAFLPHIFMIAPFLLVPAILLRVLWRNFCSRIEIDMANEKIRFFRFYHKDVVEAPVRTVEFRYTWIFTCFYTGKRFNVPGGYINPIAEVLPRGVEIKFSKSFWGRLAQRHFEKKRRGKSSEK